MLSSGLKAYKHYVVEQNGKSTTMIPTEHRPCNVGILTHRYNSKLRRRDTRNLASLINSSCPFYGIGLPLGISGHAFYILTGIRE